jgi:hypothetical protein
LDVLLLQSGQLGGNFEFLFGLGHVHARGQLSGEARCGPATREIVEQAIDFVLQRAENISRSATRDASTAADGNQRFQVHGKSSVLEATLAWSQ